MVNGSSKKINSMRQFARENLGTLVALFAMFLFLSVNPVTSGVFLTTSNMFNVLRQMSTTFYLACGLVLVIISGGIDLSGDSSIALCGCLAAWSVSKAGLPIFVGMLIGIGTGVLIGVFNGLFSAKTTIPPFIITLATSNIVKGFAYVLTDGAPVRVVSDEWNFLGAGRIFGVPVPVIIMALILIITMLILYKTKFGRYIYAIGGNPQASRFAGINVVKIKFMVYVYAGLMSGIAGIVLASRMYSGQPTAGNGAAMDAIAAVVVGGTSMNGGAGKIGGMVIGSLIIGFLNNGLNLMNISSFWQYVVKGVVIILAVFIDYIRSEKKKN